MIAQTNKLKGREHGRGKGLAPDAWIPGDKGRMAERPEQGSKNRTARIRAWVAIIEGVTA